GAARESIHLKQSPPIQIGGQETTPSLWFDCGTSVRLSVSIESDPPFITVIRVTTSSTRPGIYFRALNIEKPLSTV
ncbi:MAG: hypothetical protein ACPG7B_15850, partial [Pseudomonadales bacterium]